MDAAGIILCGGKSSRMGRDKAWLPWCGQPMIAHVVSILRPIVDEVVVVASDALELPPLEARVVRDRDLCSHGRQIRRVARSRRPAPR